MDGISRPLLSALLVLEVACGRDPHVVRATRPRRVLHTYSTTFARPENPISEGGRWITGGAAGWDWTDVSTTPGRAIGHEVGPSYTDATAILRGAWEPDQMASATVYTVLPNDACDQEVELRLRSVIRAHWSRGYEIGFKASTTADAYMFIARWNGKFGDFTGLFSRRGAQFGVTNGDVVSASIVGTMITAYKNGVQVGQVTDTTWATGSPGMGFNLENAPPGCVGTNSDYGYATYQAIDWIAR